MVSLMLTSLLQLATVPAALSSVSLLLTVRVLTGFVMVSLSPFSSKLSHSMTERYPFHSQQILLSINYPTICLSVYMSFCLYVCLWVYLYLCISVSLSKKQIYPFIHSSTSRGFWLFLLCWSSRHVSSSPWTIRHMIGVAVFSSCSFEE